MLAITLAAFVALGLIGALALGWNTPRPGRPADWEAPTLPRHVAVAPDAPWVSLFGYPSGDFTLEIIALPSVDPEPSWCDYGLIYRAQDANHYYLFAIGSDGYYAVTRVDGESATPLVTWQQFPHVRRGQRPNRLLVSCAGPSCAFRINDEYAVTVEDEVWLSGDVGLWARSLEEEVTLHFRSARVWVPDG